MRATDRSGPLFRRTVVTALLLATAAAPLSIARADVPSTITEAGHLFDVSGRTPLTGRHTLTFRLYPFDTALASEVIWTESFTVDLLDGRYNLRLGNQTPLASVLRDNAEVWLGVQVDTDSEMLPRFQFQSVPYALLARDVQGPINPSALAINGVPVIDASGQWVGLPTGLVGPAGPAGARGTAGSSGPAGAIGPAGPAGDKGDKGDRGDPGAQGLKGDQGFQGFQGSKGEKGDKGDQGIQGLEGPAGNGLPNAYQVVRSISLPTQGTTIVAQLDGLPPGTYSVAARFEVMPPAGNQSRNPEPFCEFLAGTRIVDSGFPDTDDTDFEFTGLVSLTADAPRLLGRCDESDAGSIRGTISAVAVNLVTP